jgi:hypothetical protein
MLFSLVLEKLGIRVDANLLFLQRQGQPGGLFDRQLDGFVGIPDDRDR